MIFINGFSIDKYEVTKRAWDAVRLWAAENGYCDLPVGRGRGAQPVGCISWYDAVKFCNALSELAGLTPVYRTPDGEVYRSGSTDLDSSCADTAANGYRLPSVEEWKYAARGGTKSEYFWGDTEYPDCIPYAWEFRNDEITHEVGTKKPNPYGLYDMIGNVYEWCFDQKHGHFRTLMGGSVALDAILKTDHECVVPPDYTCYETGMRVVSSAEGVLSAEEAARLSSRYGTEEWPKPVYPDMSEAAIAERLAALLGKDDFSAELRADIAAGNYRSAFDKYRNKKLGDFREKYIVKESAPTMLRSYEYLAQKDIFDIVFYKGNYEFDVYEGMPEIENVADKFAKTKDKKYLDLFIKILWAYLIRQKAEHNTLTDEVMTEWNDTPSSWAWGNGFNPGKRSMRIMTAAAIIANALDEDEYDMLPSELFAELAVSLNSYGMYPSLKDGREKISNQIAHCAGWIMSVCAMFPEFKYSELYTDFAYERWLNGIDSVMYPDGTAIEQALNYNCAPIEAYFAVTERFSDISKFEPIRKRLINTSRMLTAVMPPINDVPVSAYSGCHNVAPSPKGAAFADYLKYLCETRREYILTPDIERIQALRENPNGDCPKFNSVFFPYGGTSVIRSGWGINDRYMYLFAPRVGAGHSAEAICDIQIQAYGRCLLRTGGRFSYQQKQNMSEEDFAMMKEADNYIKYSSSARNTMLVDGKGQARLKLTEQLRFQKYSDTTGYRWYESENVVYTEGEYSGEYYSDDFLTHKREIVFLKKSGLWLVIDRMKSDKPHKYTQTWHLSSDKAGEFSYTSADGKSVSWVMDGFSDEDIVFGRDELFTKQSGSANVFIRHMQPTEYRHACGEKNPVRGWSSYEQQGKFRYFPVHEIYCDFDTASDVTLITVIEAAENESSKMKVLRKADGIFEFELEKEAISIQRSENGRVEISLGDYSHLVLDDNTDEYSETLGGALHKFQRPSGMYWEERDGYAMPVYTYPTEDE